MSDNTHEAPLDAPTCSPSFTPETVYENRGGEVWERHPDGRRELFAEDLIRKLTALECQRNEAIEIARKAMETVMQIYEHAQFCDCQSFEIADSCRIQMRGMDRINSLENTPEHPPTEAK